MDSKEAIKIFEKSTKKSVAQIERCGVGIANYVFIISTAAEKFILRCSKDADAYKDTVYWLNRLSVCEIPIPVVISEGKYEDYSCLILSCIPGNDIGNVYCKLKDSEKKQIAGEVVRIQRKVSGLDIRADAEWTWNSFVDEMLDRAEERIGRKHYFDINKVNTVRKLRQEIQEYLDKVRPTPYLDDISTKNLLIHEGKLSGIIDIDWMGLGDMLTFVAMTKVALLNMDLDTRYIDYLLDEIHPDATEYKAFVFYCLIYCVDFMGERGMQFLDKTIPVNESVIRRLNDIFDILMEEWNNLDLFGYCGVDCSECTDFLSDKCPCCRKSTWKDGDECPPVSCCKKKKIACCGECSEFPCEMMADFYKESESHSKAYERMKQTDCVLTSGVCGG